MHIDKFMNFETLLTFFITLVKIVFITSSIGHLILSQSTNETAEKIDIKFLYWKEHMEFIFIISMAILIIYYFSPISSRKPISEDIRMLFFLFGFTLIFTSKWELFITN